MFIKTVVINSRLYKNPYQRLLYGEIGERYIAKSGPINHAIREQRKSRRSIFHVHWEEALFNNCLTAADAIAAKRTFVKRVRRYIGIGGKVVWTLHNIKPHESPYLRTFLLLRRDLAKLSHRILVHNVEALEILKEQTALSDLSKVVVLPHPAYLDVYEPYQQTLESAELAPTYPRRILHFGHVRAYKGIAALLTKLSEGFMRKHRIELYVCGKPHHEAAFLDELLLQTQNRNDVKFSLEHVPDVAVANLFHSHAGIIIPYHRVLTSGVAMLALTLGTPTIAPDTPAMRGLFPEFAHDLLFNPRSTKDLQRAVLTLIELTPDRRTEISNAYIAKALEYNPRRVSLKLGEIYDELLATS